MKDQNAFQRQKQIYMQGISGEKPVIPFDSEMLRAMAKTRMSARTWAYIDGAAGDEQTLKENRAAFAGVKIIPRFMRDNTQAEFSSELFETSLPFPFLLAPLGALDMISRNADLTVASACKDTGQPMILSSQAGNTMESCAGTLHPTNAWFQLYWSKSDDLVKSLVHRAEDTGCKAIVLTTDTTMLGWRTRDLSLGYLPFLRGYGLAQYVSDPVFRKYLQEGWEEGEEVKLKPRITLETLKHVLALKANLQSDLKTAMAAVQLFTRIYTNPALNWSHVEKLKKMTSLPVVIKGILHPKDASLAVEAGADAVVVSNHGGRQVDGVVATLEMLPLIRKVVPDGFKVLLDSGIRNGSDVFKAVALGADAVLIGRPYAYGLAIDGRNGVEAVIRNFQNEFELTARLSGCRNLSEIGTDNVKPRF